ncbi:hypothetical protein DRO54_07375 [Candidatus Bathyarchaeota archaeon]|nr:MAG: hypothetical protein DRO54_07375 [Candidatus Bathyarchaeota archaeon]
MNNQANMSKERYKSFRLETLEKIAKILIDLGNSLESIGVELKEAVSKLVDHEFGLTEEVFTVLKWEKRSSDKLGEYEVAQREQNDPHAFNHAYRILEVNAADIKNHFGSKEWRYYYWLFDGSPDVIFRKKRNSA